MNAEERKAAKLAYKLAPTYYGVVQIENKQNHKRFIAAVPNIKGRWDYYRVNLNDHKYVNSNLQADWDKYGEAAFTYSVLFKDKTDEVLNLRAALKDLTKEWTARIKPEYKR